MTKTIIGWIVPMQKYLSTIDLKQINDVEQKMWDETVKLIKENKMNELHDNDDLYEIYIGDMIYEYACYKIKDIGNVLNLTEQENKNLYIYSVQDDHELYDETKDMCFIGCLITIETDVDKVIEQCNFIKNIQSKLEILVGDSKPKVYSNV
jgi:hypothetical protein